MKDLIEFARYVRPEVSGCPEIQILDAIRRSGAEFCKRTPVARVTVTVETVTDVASYDLSVLLPVGYAPDEVQRVQHPTAADLEASSEDDFDRKYLSEPGSPRYFYLDGNDLVLGHTPNEEVELTVRVKVRVSEDATQLPDELYDRYREAIAAGAKKILMMMANKPWSNLQQAAIYRSEFETAIDDANLRYAKGGGSRTLRTRLQTF
jgi:hypothetical protein